MRYIYKEIMDTDHPYQIIITNSDLFLAKFTLDGAFYEFNAAKTSPNEDSWHIVFARGLHFEITGTGNQFTVFGVIANIFKEFIRQYKPDKFMFDSGERSRTKLYTVFGIQIEKELGYKMTRRDLGRGDAYFIFTKK